jgi:hypothetical protein
VIIHFARVQEGLRLLPSLTGPGPCGLRREHQYSSVGVHHGLQGHADHESAVTWEDDEREIFTVLDYQIVSRKIAEEEPRFDTLPNSNDALIC